MAQNKTKPTASSVAAYLDAIPDDERRRDCKALARLMAKVTGAKPVLWGPSIVGFDSYHYRYASGREGDACLAGFAARSNGLAVYLVAGSEAQAGLLARLGPHRMGQACLTLRRLADVDLAVLEALVADAARETRRRHPERART